MPNFISLNLLGRWSTTCSFIGAGGTWPGATWAVMLNVCNLVDICGRLSQFSISSSLLSPLLGRPDREQFHRYRIVILGASIS